MPENSFDGFQREVIERLTRIDGKLDGYDAMKKTTYDNEKDIISIREENVNQQKQIDELRDENKWMRRTIWAAIITSIVGIVFLYIRIGMGVA